ncbi:MAG: FAD-dependent oxidoreductase [Dehalococcoidales bacterium]|jgi:2-polyprenyl-6-methoxyphenol hydroxylase-like FAD-dependent oxidoreductase
MAKNGNFIREKARDTRVVRQADVVVIGGGPGGIGAAVSAARNGADTVLIERYGYLGGMGTGGLVTIIPLLTDYFGKQQIAGITQEWIDRLIARNAVDFPKKEHWGSLDKDIVRYYFERSFFMTRLDRVCYAAIIDAEISKVILNEMVKEANIKVYCHAWGTEPIMEGNHCKGVIIESKSGRQAILGKIVIDATGDGDTFPYAGIEFEDDIPQNYRISALALCFWVDGVDLKKATEFRKTHPKEAMELSRKAMESGAFGGYFASNLPNQDSIVWFHNRYANKSQVDVEELTRVEFEGRAKMIKTYDFFKKNMSGFEKSFIVLSAPQLGTRSSRRMIGEYQLTTKDMADNQPFTDTIATFPDLDRGQASLDHPNMYIPYRTLLPRNVDNMFVACRAFSSDKDVQEYFNLIPHCIAFGEAAGTASALALKAGVGIKNVDIKALQKQLTKQGVPLPDVTKKVNFKYSGPALVSAAFSQH